MRRYASTTFGDFQCVHCGYWVTSNPQFSGVNHRNHCPYCLWSKHLDWFEAGDRLSPCKSAMRPLGLVLKRTNKKYGNSFTGELMLVHQCLECGKKVINRIAADDDVEAILAVYQASLETPVNAEDIPDVHVLGREDADLVYERLCGRVIEPAMDLVIVA